MFKGSKKIGIYGGSFSPIHIGHVAAALAFKKAIELDKLLIIPASVPPHKLLCDGVSADTRLEMCRIAFEGFDGIEVSDIELKRTGKSYTYYTVSELSAPDCELYMLCGTDMLLTFEKWFRFEEILKLVTLVYIRREDDRTLDDEIEKISKRLEERYGARIIAISVDRESAIACGAKSDGGDVRAVNIGVSSTAIREMIAKGDDIAGLVSPDVAEYIEKNGLYK